LVRRVYPSYDSYEQPFISIGNTTRIFALYSTGSFLLCCSTSLSTLQGS
jgi:hypothetical protein